MGDRASAERACKDPNPIIDGRKANVNLAILGAKPRGTVTPGEMMSSTFSGKSEEVMIDQITILIKRLTSFISSANKQSSLIGIKVFEI